MNFLSYVCCLFFLTATFPAWWNSRNCLSGHHVLQGCISPFGKWSCISSDTVSHITLFLWPPHCVLLHRSGFLTLLVNKCLWRPEQSILISFHLFYGRVIGCTGDKIVSAGLLKSELIFYKETSTCAFLKTFLLGDVLRFTQQLSHILDTFFFYILSLLYNKSPFLLIEMVWDYALS